MTAWECPMHRTVQDSYCQGCMDYCQAHPAEGFKGAEAKSAELQMWIDIEMLTIPFDMLHARFEALVRRPVWTHEFASPNLLVDEVRRQEPATMADVMDKIPASKQVIVVEVTDPGPRNTGPECRT